jgi:hypothetical protein
LAVFQAGKKAPTAFWLFSIFLNDYRYFHGWRFFKSTNLFDQKRQPDAKTANQMPDN